MNFKTNTWEKKTFNLWQGCSVLCHLSATCRLTCVWAVSERRNTGTWV